jgi:hypothetical protein
MISIIVCSKEQKKFDIFRINVAETIGVEFEIIQINNSKNAFGICEAYNEGAAKARYPYLCFVHEDVKFVTQNWGENLINHFIGDDETGVVGVAGSTYKIKMLSSWWQPTIGGIDPKRTNYIQIIPKKNSKKYFYLNPLAEIRSPVATLDGVFLATRKEIWMETRFDQKLLTGFHGYDLDFSLRVGQKFNNYVVYNILLEHDSEGVNDLNWFSQNFLVHQKNKWSLPVIVDESINSKDLRAIDKSYLESNVRFVSEKQLKILKTFSIFIKLIVASKLYRWNNTFLRSFFNEISRKYK